MAGMHAKNKQQTAAALRRSIDRVVTASCSRMLPLKNHKSTFQLFQNALLSFFYLEKFLVLLLKVNADSSLSSVFDFVRSYTSSFHLSAMQLNKTGES